MGKVAAKPTDEVLAVQVIKGITMFFNHNKNYVANAQQLRKNMTKEERHLWYDFLKKLPVTVNRQKNVGNYIVDFMIFDASIIIEIDGAQHKMPENEAEDISRDEELSALGFTVLRYTNHDVNNNFREVCNDILTRLGLSADDLNNKK